MERGVDFVRSQVASAAAAHRAFLRALEDHETSVRDERFRELCMRFIPKALEHQRLLENYQRALGDSDNVAKRAEDLARKAAGMALGVARNLADVVREDDFLKLVGDILMSRQMEDTFKTFREAGRTLDIEELASIGEIAERHHDDFNREANRLVQQMFVERARGAEQVLGDTARPRPSTS